MSEEMKLENRTFKTTNGYDARVVNCRGSYHCGYVRVPEDHPLHGKSYCDVVKRPAGFLEQGIGKRGVIDLFIMACSDDQSQCEVGVLFDVHGGITFSDRMRDAKGWWFGFDCAHAGDKTLASGFSCEGDVFRDADYCMAECESLSEQLEKMRECFE